MSEALDWSRGGPRSRRFDDIYFSAEDGLEESRVVYLEGCGLPEAWAGRRRFTIAELGFGSGLNVLAAIALWAKTRPDPGAVLHIFSLEAFPMSAADAARALAAWPELAALKQPLIASWPDRPGVFTRIEWPGLGVLLDIATLEVAEALAQWRGRADAWFLDGFAPAKNPEMWRPDVLKLIGRRSAPGARAASFTVAGAVRRGLEAEGFEITKAPGYGRKSERLVARRPGSGSEAPAPPRGPAAVIGAGIAGSALARAFRRLGRPVQVYDPDGPGAGASGNPAALVAPRLDAGFGPAARLSAQAFVRAARIYREETAEALIAEGVLHLARSGADPSRLRKIAGWTAFPEGVLQFRSAEEAARALGESQTTDALEIPSALVVEPHAVLERWTGPCERARIDRLQAVEGGYRLLGAGGEILLETDLVCIASGFAAEALAGPLGLRPVRGQLTFAPWEGAPPAASNGGAYLVPGRGGLVFGATHDPWDTDAGVRDEDDLANLARLSEQRPRLGARIAAGLSSAPLQGRAGVRGATPDHLPLAGRLDGAGVHLLAGLGGRGYLFAPLLAEAVAAAALGAPSPLPRDLEDRLDPRRHASGAGSSIV